LVSDIPLRGLQRLLVALVEDGAQSCWDEGLVDKPHFATAGAAKRGVEAYMQEVGSWSGRRCFKADCGPERFPCQLPFPPGTGTSPKVVVLFADPRHMITCIYNFAKHRFELSDTMSLAEFLHNFLCGTFVGLTNSLNVFRSVLAWTHLAERYPEQVRFFRADVLGSDSPREVQLELSRIAEFLELPSAKAAALTADLFSPPAAASQMVAKDLNPPDAGWLVESAARNILLFEEALSLLNGQDNELWRQKTSLWSSCDSARVAELGLLAARGGASAPLLSLALPMKGAELHAAGRCKPCFLAAKGRCPFGEVLCTFCHLEGHVKPNRQNPVRRRKMKDLRRMRTPSPESIGRAIAPPAESRPVLKLTLLPVEQYEFPACQVQWAY